MTLRADYDWAPEMFFNNGLNLSWRERDLEVNWCCFVWQDSPSAQTVVVFLKIKQLAGTDRYQPASVLRFACMETATLPASGDNGPTRNNFIALHLPGVNPRPLFDIRRKPPQGPLCATQDAGVNPSAYI